MSNVSSIVFAVFAPTMAISYVAGRKILGDLLLNHKITPPPKFTLGIPSRLVGLRELGRTSGDPLVRKHIRQFQLLHTLNIVSIVACLLAFVFDFTRNVILPG